LKDYEKRRQKLHTKLSTPVDNFEIPLVAQLWTKSQPQRSSRKRRKTLSRQREPRRIVSPTASVSHFFKLSREIEMKNAAPIIRENF
jgi:hypothetical protein